MSKFEPHVSSPVRDGEDVQSFISDLNELSRSAKPLSSNAGLRNENESEKSHDEKVKEGFLRFVDFVKRKNKNNFSQSRLEIALQKYRYQRDLFLDQEESQKNIIPYKTVS